VQLTTSYLRRATCNSCELAGGIVMTLTKDCSERKLNAEGNCLFSSAAVIGSQKSSSFFVHFSRFALVHLVSQEPLLSLKQRDENEASRAAVRAAVFG